MMLGISPQSQLLSILLFWSICQEHAHARLPSSIRLGSVFLEADEDVHRGFRMGIESLESRSLLNGTTMEYDIQYSHTNDFFHLYTRACLEVNYGITTLFGPNEKSLDKMLESISSNLGIPYISTAPRLGFPPSKLSLSLHPTQAQLISLIKDLILELSWKEISIIHDSQYGIINPALLAESLQFLGPVSVHQVSVDLRATLVQLRLRGARNIIIDTTSDQLSSVTQAALDTGMMSKAYTYIFTILDMKSGNWSRLNYSEALVFGFNMIDYKKFEEFQNRWMSVGQMSLEDKSKVALVLDGVELMARGLEMFDASAEVDFSSPPPTSCTDDKKWDLGQEISDAFSSVNFDGVSGPISLSSGSRVKLFIEILKLSYEYGFESPVILPIGNWSQGINYEYEGILIKDSSLLKNDKPEIAKTLVITMIESTGCYKKNDRGEEEGFCVDLAIQLSKLVGFGYKIKIVGDGRYGRADPITGLWDGLIGEVSRGEADLALADLTITASRSTVVDFTVPFLQTSLAILYKEAKNIYNVKDMETLLKPFTFWVWMSILLGFFVTALILRIVAGLSPIQKEEIIVPSSERPHSREQQLNLGNSLWILASSLILRGCDIKIKSVSSRIVTIVWWIFALIVIILYASLVSNWFNPKSTEHVTLETLVKRNQLEFGVVQSSATSFLLQNAKREDLQKLWWKIQKGNEGSIVETVGDGIQRVQNSENGNYAFISEEKMLNEAKARDCSLSVLGSIDKRSFGIAVAKDSQLRDRLSAAILTLGEIGILRQLEEKWWPVPNCGQLTEGGPRLSFVHFIGPLSFLVIGLFAGLLIAITERIFHYRRTHRGFFMTHQSETGNGKIAMNDTESDD